MTPNTRPNFLMIGANKGGTSSLFTYLQQHEDVFFPKIKEPMFFNHYFNQGEDALLHHNKVIRNIESYHELFEGSEKFKARGEASTSYLANPDCAKAIKDYNPMMKLFAVLRNPIKRAFSNYLMYVRWGIEKRSFRQALNDELNGVRLPQGQQYIYLGKYSNAVKTYQTTFSKEQVKFFPYEDFMQEPLRVIKDIFEFLEVDKNFEPNIKNRSNTNDNVETRKIFRFIRKVDRRVSFTRLMPKPIVNYIYRKPTIALSEKELLVSIYREDINKLMDLLDRDLSDWLV